MITLLIVSSVLLWLIVLLNVLLTFALVRRINQGTTSSMEKGLKPGETAPAFTASTLNEETVTHAAYANQPTTFVFISTHCDPCRDLLPALEQLGPGAKRAGGELVLVSGDDRETSKTLVSEMQLQLPVLIAPRDTNTFFDDYHITATPSYCHIDTHGMVQSAGYPGPQFSKWKALTQSWTIDVAYATNERR